MGDYLSQDLVPCRKGDPTASDAEIQAALQALADWSLVEQEGVRKLERKYKFKNFKQALDFTNRVGEAAEAGDHHPAILLEWGKVTVQWWTHVVKGLHKNDFIMAARTDSLYNQ